MVWSPIGGGPVAVGRHRGEIGVLYGRKRVRDSRGNLVTVEDPSRLFRVRMGMKMIRSNRGESKGQLTNEVVLLTFDPVDTDGNKLTDVGAWTRVEFDGRTWDLASPPAFKRGTRRTAHWEAEVRPRPPSNLRGVSGG
jgi:hypothetical protein